MSVEASFIELIALLPKYVRQSFLPVATPEQIANATNVLSSKLPDVQLPSSIVALYKTCGGQPRQTAFEDHLFPGFRLISIETAIKEYKERCNLWDVYLADEVDTEFPNKWFDYRLFPFGWANGTVYCVDVLAGKIYYHYCDGGIATTEHESVLDLIEASITYHQKEFSR